MRKTRGSERRGQSERSVGPEKAAAGTVFPPRPFVRSSSFAAGPERSAPTPEPAGRPPKAFLLETQAQGLKNRGEAAAAGRRSPQPARSLGRGCAGGKRRSRGDGERARRGDVAGAAGSVAEARGRENVEGHVENF